MAIDLKEMRSGEAEVRLCPHCGEKIIVAVGYSAAILTMEQAMQLKEERDGRLDG